MDTEREKDKGRERAKVEDREREGGKEREREKTKEYERKGKKKDTAGERETEKCFVHPRPRRVASVYGTVLHIRDIIHPCV